MSLSSTKVALESLYTLAKQFRKDKMCVVWFGPEPRVMLYDTQLISQVMTEHLDRATEYGSFLYVPTTVFNAKEELWKHKRKQMLPAFTVTTIGQYLPFVDKFTRTTIQKLMPADGPIEEVADLAPEMTSLLLQIIFTSCFGPPTPNDCELSEFLTHAHGFFHGVLIYSLCLRNSIFNLLPQGRTFHRHVQAFVDYATRLFDQQMANYEQRRGSQSLQEFVDNKPDQYFVDIMLRIYFDEQTRDLELEKYTKRTIVGELLLFIFGGFDTVATSLFWTIYLLGLNADKQEKAYQEIRQVFGDDTERPLTYDDLNRLRYVEAACKEATRVYSNPVVARHITRDIYLDGKLIPKDTTVIVDKINTHHNAQIFPEPHEFRPERFLNKVQPYSFLTWSAGPRNCVGQRFALMLMKSILCILLRKYRIESLVPRSEMKPKIGFITRPSVPARTRFIRRHQ